MKSKKKNKNSWGKKLEKWNPKIQKWYPKIKKLQISKLRKIESKNWKKIKSKNQKKSNLIHAAASPAKRPAGTGDKNIKNEIQESKSFIILDMRPCALPEAGRRLAGRAATRKKSKH